MNTFYNSKDDLHINKGEIKTDKKDELEDLMFSVKNINRTENIFNVEILVNDKPLEEYTSIKGTSVLIPDNTEYKIRLTNNNETQCDAVVKIDNLTVGRFRIFSKEKLIIERPSNYEKKFIFIKGELNDSEGQKKCGIIQVDFLPERQSVYANMAYKFTGKRKPEYDDLTPMEKVEPNNDNMDIETTQIKKQKLRTNGDKPIGQNFDYGKTILGEKSTQKFVTLEYVTNIDFTKTKTIEINMFVKI